MLDGGSKFQLNKRWRNNNDKINLKNAGNSNYLKKKTEKNNKTQAHSNCNFNLRLNRVAKDWPWRVDSA